VTGADRTNEEFENNEDEWDEKDSAGARFYALAALAILLAAIIPFVVIRHFNDSSGHASADYLAGVAFANNGVKHDPLATMRTRAGINQLCESLAFQAAGAGTDLIEWRKGCENTMVKFSRVAGG
jgi:hypothetical protein